MGAKKHNWQLCDVWGETIPVCTRCGQMGAIATLTSKNSIGWRGEPVYGCESAAIAQPEHRGA